MHSEVEESDKDSQPKQVEIDTKEKISPQKSLNEGPIAQILSI